MTRPTIEAGDAPHFPAGAAVVIGGSGGVGQATVARLAEHGTDVVATYFGNKAKAEQAVEAVAAASRKGEAMRLDLTDRAAARTLFDDVAARYGAVHTVVFATGADISMTYVADIDDDEFDRTIASDLTGFYNVMKAALPHLRASRGSIVAMTSAGLVKHPPKDILSTVPKAGVEALIRGLAREEGRYGVRANAVALGVIDAGLFHRLTERLTENFVEAMKKNTALRRFGTAREAADAAVFLASSNAGFITGQSLVLDGGFAL